MPLKVDRVLDRVRSVPRTRSGNHRLSAMLRQDGRHFHKLSAGDAERVRGHILAAFEQRGVPECALPVIREELRTSFSPIVLAGAARAVCGLEAVDEELRSLLEGASERIALRDEYVRFDGARSGRSSPPALTARQEIAAALARVSGSPHHCCGKTVASKAEMAGAEPLSLCPGALAQVTVEDQFGGKARLVELLRERTSLIAFFYTRCMNPAKCSLTISRLAAFARHALAGAKGHDLNLLALSYDSDYDVPARLHAFGRDRGFPFGDHARMMRCLAGWNAVRREFRLQVGYGESTVNEHARELFLVNPDLRAIGIDAECLADNEALMGAMTSFRTRFPHSSAVAQSG